MWPVDSQITLNWRLVEDCFYPAAVSLSVCTFVRINYYILCRCRQSSKQLSVNRACHDAVTTSSVLERSRLATTRFCPRYYWLELTVCQWKQCSAPWHVAARELFDLSCCRTVLTYVKSASNRVHWCMCHWLAMVVIHLHFISSCFRSTSDVCLWYCNSLRFR